MPEIFFFLEEKPKLLSLVFTALGMLKPNGGPRKAATFHMS